jgi:soluble lytic murein transglycosylase-like protein
MNDWQEEPTLVGVREVDYDPLDFAPSTNSRSSCLTIALLVMFIIAGFAGTLGVRELFFTEPAPNIEIVENTNISSISPIFTAEVQYWADDITRWSQEYNLDPNLVATVMQIESCGDPQAGSGAGAQGLFQVMPFHFAEGEAMLDIDNNAKRGLDYLSVGLQKSNGHVGLALAGYNGGHGMIDWGYARWPNETRRYHYWGTGIYYDAISGAPTSERLNEWLGAGGEFLCRQASAVQTTLSSNSS